MSATRITAPMPSAWRVWWRSIASAIAGVDAPAPGEDAADESVVDAELAALLGDPVIGGCAAPVEALGVAGMQAGQDGAADVVENRRQGELVALADAAHLGDPVGGALHDQRVEAEAVGRESEPPVAVEDVVGGRGAKNGLHRARAEPLDAVADAADAARRPGSGRPRG